MTATCLVLPMVLREAVRALCSITRQCSFRLPLRNSENLGIVWDSQSEFLTSLIPLTAAWVMMICQQGTVFLNDTLPRFRRSGDPYSGRTSIERPHVCRESRFDLCRKESPVRRRNRVQDRFVNSQYTGKVSDSQCSLVRCGRV